LLSDFLIQENEMPRVSTYSTEKVIDNFLLIETDMFCDGIYEEKFCEVIKDGEVLNMYDSFNEAMKMKNSWEKICYK